VSDIRAKSNYNRGEGNQRNGDEVRRSQFTKDSYRQPVLTQDAMVPKNYRRGQNDPLTLECRQKLKELQQYSLMEDPTIEEDTEAQKNEN